VFYFGIRRLNLARRNRLDQVSLIPLSGDAS
jgi:hypothetical protein